MLIYYKNKKIKTILEDAKLVKKHYGEHSNSIMNRMTELSAANCLNDIPTCPPPVRHKLTGKREGQWAVRYSKNHRIIFEPYGKYEISDIKSIKEIIIIELGDYH